MPLNQVYKSTVGSTVIPSRPPSKRWLKELTVLRVLMREVGCPVAVSNGYLNTIQRRLDSEGHGFLSLCRGLPVIGLKVLGSDATIILPNGLKRQTGKLYPRLLSWFFSKLQNFSQKRASSAAAKKARKILSVLSFASMFTIRARRQRKLLAYADSVTRKLKFKGKVYPECTRQFLLNQLGIARPELIDQLPSYRDFDSLSFRPCAARTLEKRQASRGFMLELCTATQWDPENKDILSVPHLGDVILIDEPAGKCRIICAYNDTFIHSNGLFTRARHVLDSIIQDVSNRQSRAKGFCVRASKDHRTYISGDLSSFTDNISELYIDKVLTLLDLKDLKAELFSIPVRIQGVKPEKRIVPSVLLMGLRGCFEVGSLAHHLVLREIGCQRYVLCCDDILAPVPMEIYLNALKRLGPALNRGKTVVSKSVVTFCGMSYWGGHNVKAFKFKLSKFDKFDDGTTYDYLRDLVSNMRGVYKHRTVSKIYNFLVDRYSTRVLYSRGYRPTFVPNLPTALGGFGFGGSKLLSVLATEDGLFTANKSVGIEKPKTEFNRWFKIPIDITPSGTRRVLPWLPTLLAEGSTLDLREPVVNRRLFTTKIKLEDILEWYYFKLRVPIQGSLRESDIYER